MICFYLGIDVWFGNWGVEGLNFGCVFTWMRCLMVYGICELLSVVLFLGADGSEHHKAYFQGSGLKGLRFVIGV